MNISFYQDADTGEPHIHSHGVREHEVVEVLSGSRMHLKGRRDALLALGQTFNGRYLKIVYKRRKDDLFVITAYDLAGKSLSAYRRRLRRKGK